MSQTKLKTPTYKDGVTKQSFKDETDINKIIQTHARLGTLSHLEQWGGTYGDLANFNFQEAQNQIAEANSMFEHLPPEVRKQFKGSPELFLEYVNDPDNQKDLAEKLPALAKPGFKPPNVHPTADNPLEPDPEPTEANTAPDPEPGQ